MKSILMSIQPEYCELIASGKKTIEVRKTAPQAPFRAFIYQTKKKWIYRLLEWLGLYQQKIIGEFICDKVDIYSYEVDWYNECEEYCYDESKKMYYIQCGELECTCLTYDELLSYGKGKTLYGLNITAVKAYDKPKELSDFRKPDTSCGFYIKDLERCDSGYNCERCVYNDLTITKPPQSWQYVETDWAEGDEMNDNIKPCPFCGCNNISVKLKTDCYSSWARVECQRCMAYAETGTDKPHATCPMPVEDWRECGIRKWNREVSKPKTEVIER